MSREPSPQPSHRPASPLPVALFALALACLALSLAGLARADFAAVRAASPGALHELSAVAACATDARCLIEHSVPLGAGPRWASGSGR